MHKQNGYFLFDFSVHRCKNKCVSPETSVIPVRNFKKDQKTATKISLLTSHFTGKYIPNTTISIKTHAITDILKRKVF